MLWRAWRQAGRAAPWTCLSSDWLEGGDCSSLTVWEALGEAEVAAHQWWGGVTAWPQVAAQHSDSASLCSSQSPSVLDGMCTQDADCPMGNPVVHGNGTGCFAKETKS